MAAVERQLAEFVADFPAERIPAEITHIAKRLLLNEFGVSLYAAQDPAVRILLDIFADEGGNQLATVIGHGTRTNLRNAALVNGFLGHFEDYDDTHLATVIHAGSPIYPAALAVAENTRASGRALLTAMVLGIEVACRIGNLIVPKFREGASFWHITNTCGVFGAASAAARLMGLPAGQMEHAFGIAGTQASGLREVFGSMSKPFHAGKAAENGLLAAMLAGRGFTSISADSKGILEGPRGFAAVMAKDYDVADLVRALGDRWELPRIAIKPHACGQATHSLLDSVAELRAKPGVTPKNVASIHGTVERMAPAIESRRHPQKGLEGKFSYHHAMACVLVDGHAFPQQFVDAKVNDPLIKSLRDRIDVSVDTSLPRFGASASLTLNNGTTYTATTHHSVGAPENPLSDDRLEAKFRAVAGVTLSKDRVERLIKEVWSLDRADTMSPLMALLAASQEVAA